MVFVRQCIFRSPDFATWTHEPSIWDGRGQQGGSVAFCSAHGCFVAVARSGPSLPASAFPLPRDDFHNLLSSADGSVWGDEVSSISHNESVADMTKLSDGNVIIAAHTVAVGPGIRVWKYAPGATAVKATIGVDAYPICAQTPTRAVIGDSNGHVHSSMNADLTAWTDFATIFPGVATLNASGIIDFDYDPGAGILCAIGLGPPIGSFYNCQVVISHDDGQTFDGGHFIVREYPTTLTFIPGFGWVASMLSGDIYHAANPAGAWSGPTVLATTWLEMEWNNVAGNLEAITFGGGSAISYDDGVTWPGGGAFNPQMYGGSMFDFDWGVVGGGLKIVAVGEVWNDRGPQVLNLQQRTDARSPLGSPVLPRFNRVRSDPRLGIKESPRVGPGSHR